MKTKSLAVEINNDNYEEFIQKAASGLLTLSARLTPPGKPPLRKTQNETDEAFLKRWLQDTLGAAYKQGALNEKIKQATADASKEIDDKLSSLFAPPPKES